MLQVDIVSDISEMLSLIRVSRLSNLTASLQYSSCKLRSRLISFTTTPTLSSPSTRVSSIISPSSFLSPTSRSPLLVQATAGMKTVGVVEKRCRHCYTIIQDEVKYNMCTAKPRHRQAQKQVATKFGNMILTHATQGSKRSNGRGTRHIKTQQSFRLDFE